MRKFKNYPFQKKNNSGLFQWLNRQDVFCLYSSNNQNKKDEVNFEFLIGSGISDPAFLTNNLDDLDKLINTYQDYLFGFLSYDLKNKIEPQLTSFHSDGIGFPEVHFFIPRYVFIVNPNEIRIGYLPDYDNPSTVDTLYQKILKTDYFNETAQQLQIKSRINHTEYLEKISLIKEHIQRGDIYEMNFCQEFYAENASINPVEVFVRLNQISKAPFSAFCKLNGNYLICASPERFIKKAENKIISQPIKGTIKRGKNAEEDNLLKDTLYNNPKERSENVMIVDLVRNDLSKIAKRGSVKVDELYGIYTFKQVHQMISTISADLKESAGFEEIIKAMFPMGSMTGAPKIRAMELIEKYENTKRGLYSGSVGYISPEGDFDFNVVIRSILYNSASGYVSFMVGSAITAQSDPEQEYRECLLKAKAMFQALSADRSTILTFD